MASASDKAWLLSVQTALYQRSRKDPDYSFDKLWGFVTDPRNLRSALARVARNPGRRTAGVDGVTVRSALARGAEAMVADLRERLRHGAFAPRPVRRVFIPKAGHPGKFRPLGIPTVTDRVVQAAVKNILEPVFEADFYPTSFGFRPGRSAHGALEYLRLLLRPRASSTTTERRIPYQWAVEGDIKGCFDNIDHHALMVRVRRRIGDHKVLRLVLAFLRAGVLSEEQFFRTSAGTPQGGILSPLLANIALHALDERYERHVWPRRTTPPPVDRAAIMVQAGQNRRVDRRRGRCLVMPVRYADDFLLLVGAPPGATENAVAERVAHAEKAAVAEALQSELKLELSETKTLVTSVTQPIRFLGHHVRVRRHPGNRRLVSTTVIPKDRSHQLRERIKDLFVASTCWDSLAQRLKLLNPMLRGWCNFYRHAWGAKKVFKTLDHYVWWTIYRWLRKKHPRVAIRRLRDRYGWYKPGRGGVRWGDGEVRPFEASSVHVQQFMMVRLRPPPFAIADGEPGA